mgnify:CR=1 FL=1
MKIIDMHCDTIMALMNTENNIYESTNMIDIKKLKQGDYFTFSIIYRIEWQYDNMNPKTLSEPQNEP